MFLRTVVVIGPLDAFIVMTALLCRGVRSAIVLCIALAAVVGFALGLAEPPKEVFSIPVGGEYDLRSIALIYTGSRAIRDVSLALPQIRPPNRPCLL